MSSHVGHGLLDGFLIPQELHGNDGLQVFVQLVHEWNSGGEVESHDGLVTHPVQVLDHAPERVPMSGDEDALAGLKETKIYAFSYHIKSSTVYIATLICGTITSFQYGSVRAMVNLSDSNFGNSSPLGPSE